MGNKCILIGPTPVHKQQVVIHLTSSPASNNVGRTTHSSSLSFPCQHIFTLITHKKGAQLRPQSLTPQMDFGFETAEMANQQQNIPMQHILNQPPHPMPWTAPTQPAHQELPAMQVPQPRQAMAHHSPHEHEHQKPHPHYLPQPLHPQQHHPPHHPMLSAEVKPPMPQKPTTEFPRKDGFPQVNLEIAIQMGGLRYADLRKEQAREWFKEQKKNEHMAKGEFDRMKRRKKGDTSMTPREKYVRRLKMNQDSAAAARYAQEEYVSVLEKLVQSVEMELGHERQQNSVLQKKVAELQSAADEGVKLDVQTFLDAPDRFNKKFDPLALSKWLDMVTSPAPVSAQDNDPNFAAGKMGIQPAPAV